MATAAQKTTAACLLGSTDHPQMTSHTHIHTHHYLCFLFELAWLGLSLAGVYIISMTVPVLCDVETST